MVCLDGGGQVVRPALLWNDVRSADAAHALVAELGDTRAWARAVGVVPLAAITVTKLRWLADHEAPYADRTAAVWLPYHWLTWRLRGDTDIAALTTDRSDASGTGYYDAATARFADGTGRYLPLVCTLNGARVLDAAAGMLRVDHDELSRLALSAPPGNAVLVLVPYLEGERTPSRPKATGALHGLRVSNATPANLARAAVEGLLCSLADGIARLSAQGIVARRILLVGGGARSTALRKIAPAVFGMPVLVPAPAEHVALGAARQAAWALSGSPRPPSWRSTQHRRVHRRPIPRGAAVAHPGV